MPLHPHEHDRLESLRSYAVMDTPPERAYDALTRLAALVCETPVAAVSLVDGERQWYKSAHGTDLRETARADSFCTHAVAASAPLVVLDATADPRFADNPYVVGGPRVRAYAGMPLVGRDGLPLGTLCVVDVKVRSFTGEQLGALRDLADQVVALLELRRSDALHGRPPALDDDPLTDPVRLRRALDDGELVPWYQPLVDLATGRPLGFEALLRWEHPEQGVLPPAAFLTAVESSGLVLPVGRHVLRSALAVLRDLRSGPEVPDLLGVAVNVSAVQLATPGLTEAVAHELAAHGVPPNDLSLEITETAGILDDATARHELQALRDLGVHLAVDDYGTGWSGLARVLDLPMTALKLDRSVVGRLPYDVRAVAVARSTLTMAADLGIGVVAEGVETASQRDCLLELGCTYGQGYLFGRPVPARDLGAVLAPWTAAGAVPAPRADPMAAAGPPRAHWHSVQIYRDDAELVSGICDVVLPSLRTHDAVVVVATAAHLALVAQAVEEAGVDLPAVGAQGRVVLVDADERLAAFAPGGVVTVEAFEEHVAGPVRALARRHGHVRVYGEMVALLWDAGRHDDALKLEQLWNDLAREIAISTHCGYPQTLFERGSSVRDLQALCELHTGVA